MYSRRDFLWAGVGLSAAALLMPGASFAANNKGLIAGAGRAEVDLSGMYPLGEFTGEHDPLNTRVLLLDNGSQRQAIAVIDLTSITAEVIAHMKEILAQVTGVTANNAIINASHTFSTPHIFLHDNHGQNNATQAQQLLDAFDTALRKAAQQAVATLQPATLGAGSGTCRAGVNRNVETPWGWWLGADDAGYTDPHVGVLRIDGHNGKPLAILLNYAVQPAVMDASQSTQGGRLVSADLAGAAANYIENACGNGTVAFYLVGSAGDQVPYLQASRHVVNSDGSVGRTDIHEEGFTLVDLLGQRLGAEAMRVANRITPNKPGIFALQRYQVALPAQKFSPRNAPKGPVKTFTYQPSGTTEAPVTLVQWGDTALVCVQPELSASIGAHIRNTSVFANTFVITMSDGAAKYLPDAENYDRFTYEARSSPFARGAAEMLAENIIKQLKQLKTHSA
ncbi:hypothetical protein [Mangrovibacter yixingensis]|uniref:hypothetical protein n=1 Tax=Mangrovibacter yixingensis TaxID=1529639 RepID=UPI001CFA7D65|nr:hypothetical protein [Mangrovibacter yixingensis]